MKMRRVNIKKANDWEANDFPRIRTELNEEFPVSSIESVLGWQWVGRPMMDIISNGLYTRFYNTTKEYWESLTKDKENES